MVQGPRINFIVAARWQRLGIAGPQSCNAQRLGSAILRGLVRVVLVFWGMSTFAVAEDIDGRWMTLDLRSGAKRSVIEITHTNNDFRGRIVELFIQTGEPPDPRCELCAGARHGQHIRGMEILFVSPATDGTGYAGKVLDPEEGLLYTCTVTLDGSGKRLSIRGYVGIPLLGRTVVWDRVE
jgi:uncharacterized protein (DUF2147 family)